MSLLKTLGAGFSVASFYRVTWQLLIGLTAVLAVGSGVVRPWVGLPAFICAFLLVTTFGQQLLARGRFLSIVIGVLLLALAVEEVLRVHRLEEFIQAMLEMITGALSLLLLRQSQARSYWLAVLNVVVIAVGSISLTSSALVYGVFLLQTGCVLLNMNAANLHLARPGERSLTNLPQGYLTQFLLVLPIGSVAAMLIFLAFPRVQSFTMALTAGLGGRRTGYSGLVSLSGGGEVQESQTLAFMVEADDPDWLSHGTASLLFRGDALDEFDGRRWTSSVFNMRAAAGSDLLLATKHTRDIHVLTVHLEPTPLATLFYPGLLLSVTPRAGSTWQVLSNANGTVIRDRFSMDRITYDLSSVAELEDSDLPSLPLAQVRGDIAAQASLQASSLATLSPSELEAYLKVPERIRQAAYFRSWLSELRIKPAEDDIATLQRRLTQQFTSRFTPTLANELSGPEPLAAFLSTKREGHCEYFATAAALTLRVYGVPARVVVGYLGGTYNDLAEALEVRDADAHAWVEAFVPGVGWHSYNPTPPTTREAKAGTLAILRLYTNGLGFLMRRYLVDYDQSTQRTLWNSLQGFSPQPTLTRGSLGATWLASHGRTAALITGLVVMFWWLSQLWRGQRPAASLPRYYQRFLRRQQRAGRPRLSGETFAVYHRRLAGLVPREQAEVLPQLTQRLEQDLYQKPKA